MEIGEAGPNGQHAPSHVTMEQYQEQGPAIILPRSTEVIHVKTQKQLNRQWRAI